MVLPQTLSVARKQKFLGNNLFLFQGLAERPPSPWRLPQLSFLSSMLQATSNFFYPVATLDTLAIPLLVLQELHFLSLSLSICLSFCLCLCLSTSPPPSLPFMNKSCFPIRFAEPWGKPSGHFVHLAFLMPLESQYCWEQIRTMVPLVVDETLLTSLVHDIVSTL